MRRHLAAPIAGLDNFTAPTCPEHAADNLQQLAEFSRKASETSRRSFLGRGLATAAAVPAAMMVASAASQGATPVVTGATLPSFYPGSTAATFGKIQVDEATHVNIIIAAIESLGGTPRPLPTFQNLIQPNATAFVGTAIALENTGVHAYFGAAPALYNGNVVAVALSIALTEAYHSGFLNTLGNQPLLPGNLTYATPYTIAQVVAAASPFIVSLNDNGAFPLTFSSTPSPANDIAILNFALALEFLEAEYYYYNVPAMFPGTV